MRNMIDKQKAIDLAASRISQIYPDAVVLRATHCDRLEEFERRAGWRVWFQVEGSDFGRYDRPIEVDRETGEVRLVKILL